MKFQDKLQMLRKAKGLSQEKLGYEIGVSRQAITKWENGTAMPEVEKILALSEYFNVTTDYLLKDAIETPHNEVQPSIRKKPKVSRRFIIGVALLTAAIVTWMVLLVLSRSIPVYSLTGNGPSMADFLEYHSIRFIGYAAAAAGTGGLLMIGAELWIQHTRKAKR